MRDLHALNTFSPLRPQNFSYNFVSTFGKVSGQCLRGAEGESYPQSPPAGAFLLKKKTTVRDSFGQDKFAWDKFGCDKFGSILSVLVYLVFVNINFLKCLSLNINFTNVLCA